MTDLGGGVYEQEDYGGPVGPFCPICPVDKPHRVVPNESRLGGFRCENCGWVFAGDHGEASHPRNRRRRDLWAQETGHRQPPAPEQVAEVRALVARARQALRRTPPDPAPTTTREVS